MYEGESGGKLRIEHAAGSRFSLIKSREGEVLGVSEFRHAGVSAE